MVQVARLMPNRWALLVGVNYYRDAHISNLRYCAADAKALSDLFLSRPEYRYSPDRVALLVSTGDDNIHATRLQILNYLYKFARQTKSQDLFLFYFSGHGTIINNEPYLLTADSISGDLLIDTALPLRRIVSVMKSHVKAKDRVIILDACYAGVELRTKSPEKAQAIFTESVEKVCQETEGIAIMASSSHNEPSLEDSRKEHGVFTYYLLQAFQDRVANDNHDNDLTISEVFRYVTERMRQEYPQRPTLKFEGSGEIVLSPVLMPSTRWENPLWRSFPVAVKKDEDFFGRAEELHHIENILRYKTDLQVLIRGERRVGKTSFLNRIKSLLDEEQWMTSRRFVHFDIAPHSMQTVEDFAREIWAGIVKSVEKYLPSGFQQDNFDFKGYRDFSYHLERVGALVPETTFVIFIDEFDTISHNVSQMVYRQIVSLLHYLLEKAQLPLLFIVSTLGPLPDSYASDPPTERIFLHPFERKEFNEMILHLTKDQIQPNEDVLKKLFAFSGGNPYFAKLLLFSFYEIQRERKSVIQWTDEIVCEIVKKASLSPDAHNVFLGIYNKHMDDPQRALLLLLARDNNYTIDGISIASSALELRTAAQRLHRRDYLIQRPDGGYQLRIALMGEWLRQWEDFEKEMERLRVVDIPSTVVQEGVCIDLSTERVYVDGNLVTEKLSDLRFRALVYLAQNSDNVVSREELFQVLYPKDNYVKSDQALDALISRIRREILKDIQKPPRYLETLRKRGFRLKRATLIRTSLRRKEVL